MTVFLTTWSGSPPVSAVRLLPQFAGQCAQAAHHASENAVTQCRRSWGGNGWPTWSVWARTDWTTTRDFSRTRGSSSSPRREIGGPASSLSCWATWLQRPQWPWDEQVSCHSICSGEAVWGQGSWCPRWGSARPRFPLSFQKNTVRAVATTSSRSPSGITRWRE